MRAATSRRLRRFVAASGGASKRSAARRRSAVRTRCGRAPASRISIRTTPGRAGRAAKKAPSLAGSNSTRPSSASMWEEYIQSRVSDGRGHRCYVPPHLGSGADAHEDVAVFVSLAPSAQNRDRPDGAPGAEDRAFPGKVIVFAAGVQRQVTALLLPGTVTVEAALELRDFFAGGRQDGQRAMRDFGNQHAVNAIQRKNVGDLRQVEDMILRQSKKEGLREIRVRIDLQLLGAPRDEFDVAGLFHWRHDKGDIRPFARVEIAEQRHVSFRRAGDFPETDVGDELKIPSGEFGEARFQECTGGRWKLLQCDGARIDFRVIAEAGAQNDGAENEEREGD